MALDFLGGLAGAYTAIQKGVDDAKESDLREQRRKWMQEDRQRLLVDRDYQDKQRVREAEDRDYQLGLRKREADEYERKQKLREANAAITLGAEVDDTPAMPGAAPTPVPGAAAAGTVAPSATPAPDTFAGQNTAPAAPAADAAQPAAAPAPAARRRITYGEVLRRLSENERKFGDPARSLDLAKQADQWTIDQASKRLTTLMSSADSMPLDQYAAEAAKLFNEDPLPQSITGMTKNPDGSVTVTIKHRDNGATASRTFKNSAELTSALQSFYQPDQFAKLQQAAIESRNKLRDELVKPRVLKPGETFVAYNPETKKFETLVEGAIPKGYEPVTTPSGDTVLRKIDGGTGTGTGTGGGKGGKVTEPANAASDMFEAAATKGEVKLQPNQIATGSRMAQDMARRGVDPALAADVAMQVALDPAKARLEINYTTGEVDQVFQDPRINGGKPVSISVGAGTIQEIEKQAGGAAKMKPAVASMVDHMVAALPAEKRDANRAKLIEVAASPELTKQFLEAAAQAGKDTTALARQLSLIKTYLPPEQAKDAERRTEPNRRSFFGGLLGGEDYVPPADSPAGRALARREEQAQGRAQKQAAVDAERQQVAAGVSNRAYRILRNRNVQAAAALQDSPDFDLLPLDQKTAIFRLVNGR